LKDKAAPDVIGLEDIELDTDALPSTMAVGWSGGADSTALLLLLKQRGFSVEAWHVDHAWRDDSAEETAILKKQAGDWGIKLRTARLKSPTGRNMEAESRQGRYAQFALWAEQSGIYTLCLGHHRDDQAETVCMRLLQGAGMAGCCGMQSQRSYGPLSIVRPLLQVRATLLRQALGQAGISWLEDPSNNDQTLWRNHIRHGLFPAISRAGRSPTELFLRWQAQAERLTTGLDSTVEQLMGVVVEDHAQLIVPWAIWRTCSAPVRARLLQKMMATLLGEGATPGRRHILMVESWTTNSGRGGLDLSRCRLERRRKHLHLRRTTAGFVLSS